MKSMIKIGVWRSPGHLFTCYGLVVLLIFAVGWILLRRRDWFQRPGVRGYASILITGLPISVSVELAAVHILERWAYTTQMPLVPGLGIGITPVARMLVLPPLVFRIVTACCTAGGNKESLMSGLGSSFELAGLLTHLIVFVIGIGALVGVVPLARGRRAGLGLVLMALSMTVLVLEPRWHLGILAAAAYVTGFTIALWLLLGPARS
jgi:hypothetical protein